MPTSIVGRFQDSSPQAGFAYVMVLVAVVIAGILVGVADVQTSHIIKREQEEELLFRGMAYRNAIRSYYESGNNSYPRMLEDLLKDPRFLQKRHLRSRYPEPISRGKSDWKIIRSADGGIAGVACESKERPLKTANFPPGMEQLAKAQSYAEWSFVYIPQQNAKQQILGDSKVASEAARTPLNIGN